MLFGNGRLIRDVGRETVVSACLGEETQHPEGIGQDADRSHPSFAKPLLMRGRRCGKRGSHTDGHHGAMSRLTLSPAERKGLQGGV